MTESNIQSGEIAVPEPTTQTLFEITSVQRIARKDLGLLARVAGFKPHSWQFSNNGLERAGWRGMMYWKWLKRQEDARGLETTDENEDVNDGVKHSSGVLKKSNASLPAIWRNRILAR
jgi:hypothetical protein